MLLLVDADSAIYKAGHANEELSYEVSDAKTGNIILELPYKKEVDDWVAENQHTEVLVTRKKRLKGPLSHSISNLKRVCDKMLSVSHSKFSMFLGGKGNFRYDIYPEYKANRKDVSGPIHEKELRQYLINRFNALVVEGEEVDDRVSWIQCLSEQPTCIVSIDKDLYNTPGAHYNYDKETYKEISEGEANTNFARQLLSGDSTDNVPGLAGIGNKTAYKLLPEERNDWQEFVLGKYNEEFGDEDGRGKKQLTLMGQLLWLRRKPGELWQMK